MSDSWIKGHEGVRPELGTGVVELVPAREQIRVVARGEIDIATAPDVVAAVEQVIDVGFRQVVIDLRDVSFIDIVGVHALDDASRVARRAAARASILASEQVRRVLALTGVLARLDVETPPKRRRFMPRASAPAPILSRRLRAVE